MTMPKDLADNLAKADAKYPPHTSIHETMGALHGEMWELEQAVHARNAFDIRAELLDVVTVAIRGIEAMDERAKKTARADEHHGTEAKA